MRKTSLILSRVCMAVFFAQIPLSFVVDYHVLLGLIPLGLAFALRVAANRRPSVPQSTTLKPTEVAPPVAGRWSALHSPADSVPSHGVHDYGQTYAIDIVAESEDRPRPAFGWWPVARRNHDFPAFGAPLLAVADATVVTAVDHRRDHLSRNSYPVLLYWVFEMLARDMGGPGAILGNHVILDLGGGTYAAYAHLRRGSLAVREGERVRRGQRLAECGNSGNSTEPHLHFQLMDHPDLYVARGLPFSWRGVGVPRNGEVFALEDTPAA